MDRSPGSGAGFIGDVDLFVIGGAVREPPLQIRVFASGDDHPFGQSYRDIIFYCRVKYYGLRIRHDTIRNTQYAIRNTQYAIDSRGRWRVLRPPVSPTIQAANDQTIKREVKPLAISSYFTSSEN